MKLALITATLGVVLAGLAIAGSTDSRAVAACGLTAPAFCDTFDAPAGTGNRAGELDGNVWGVSRQTGHTNGFGGIYDAWAAASAPACDNPTPVLPPNDVEICNGQLREVLNDGGNVTVLAMYPKQPFDFAGRTGTVAFDVSNDTQGTHAAWPEFWVTDQPIPAPFTHFDTWLAAPRNGFGVRFAAGADPGQLGLCPNGNNIDQPRWTVDSAVVSRNFVIEDTAGVGAGSLSVTQLDCVTKGSFAAMNHVEVRVSQSQIDVWATDAGASTLKHIAAITGANLSFSRGLVWLEDVHYNASKGGNGTQAQHTFAWDNLGFDGPATYRDLSYDVLDSLVPDGDGHFNLGRRVASGQPLTVNTLPIPAVVGTAANVMFNAVAYSFPTGLAFTLNGHPYSVAGNNEFWGNPQTIAVPVSLADIVPGPNVIRFTANQIVVLSNVNLVLVNAAPVPGGTPSPPTSTPTPSATHTPTAPPQATSTPTATPTTPSATPTTTPTGPLRQCQLRWGKTVITDYGMLTEAECAAKGR